MEKNRRLEIIKEISNKLKLGYKFNELNKNEEIKCNTVELSLNDPNYNKK